MARYGIFESKHQYFSEIVSFPAILFLLLLLLSNSMVNAECLKSKCKGDEIKVGDARVVSNSVTTRGPLNSYKTTLPRVGIVSTTLPIPTTTHPPPPSSTTPVKSTSSPSTTPNPFKSTSRETTSTKDTTTPANTPMTTPPEPQTSATDSEQTIQPVVTTSIDSMNFTIYPENNTTAFIPVAGKSFLFGLKRVEYLLACIIALVILIAIIVLACYIVARVRISRSEQSLKGKFVMSTVTYDIDSDSDTDISGTPNVVYQSKPVTMKSR